MSRCGTAMGSIFYVFFLISLGGCAHLSSPGVAKIDAAAIKVSTTPLLWQRERGPFFNNPDEARRYAENLILDGRGDWRLPTREEMLDFYYAFDFGSADAAKLGINIEGYYWVVDDDGNITAGSWCDGEICEISRNYRPSSRGGYVRAVHQ